MEEVGRREELKYLEEPRTVCVSRCLAYPASFFLPSASPPLPGKCVELGINCVEISILYFHSGWLPGYLLLGERELSLSPWSPGPLAPPPWPLSARTAPSLASVGTPGRSDRFCWLLRPGNIAARLAFVLPLITAWRPRLGGLPAICYLLRGGGQARTWTARGWAGAGDGALME